MVRTFYNEATVHELNAVPGCSKKKVDIILGVRPFEDWNDLVSSLVNIIRMILIGCIYRCTSSKLKK